MSDQLYESNPLRAALRACRRHFIYAGVFSGLINVLYLVPSIFMLQVYDRVVPTRGGTTLLVLSLILAISLIVFALLATLGTEARAVGSGFVPVAASISSRAYSTSTLLPSGRVLIAALAGKAEIDHETGRRLFTLISVLQRRA